MLNAIALSGFIHGEKVYKMCKSINALMMNINSMKEITVKKRLETRKCKTRFKMSI